MIDELLLSGSMDESPDSLLEQEEVSPASRPPPDTIRRELLSRIRARIKTGYYNSDAVVDDLCESFAKVFDR